MNNRKAQTQFYARHYKSVYNSSLRILGNPQEAEEVMQETFLKVFTKPGLFQKDHQAMERVLKRIAINHSIDICRKRKVSFVELSPSLEIANEEEAEDMDAEIGVIRAAIKDLPEGYRIILSLHLIEDMAYEEIAKELDISASGVRSQYARARQKLIQMVKNRMES